MILIFQILATLCGAILYRIRGGGFGDIPNNKIYFPIFIGILYGILSNWSIEYIINGFAAAYIAQQITGWGTYRSALVSGSTDYRVEEECPMIDDIINTLKITFDDKVYKISDYPRICGFIGCSLRGLLSSFIIGSNIACTELKYCGILVGLCYLIPVIILWKTKYHNTKTAWNIGEYLEGALYTYVFVMEAL